MKKISYIFFLGVCSLATSPGLIAQELDSFLSCGEISDRVERVLCLESALEEANTVEGVELEDQQSQVSAIESFGEPSNQEAEVHEEFAEEESSERRSFFSLPRIGNIFRRDDSEVMTDAAEVRKAESEIDQSEQLAEFGVQSRIVVNEDGKDELNDIVMELVMARPDQWLMKLASGQVWRQTHPRRLNLREGDAVKIYPSGWGENFRLEAERLSGFIQVLRVE